MIFVNQKEKKQTENSQFASSSSLGRAITSVASAKQELFVEHKEFNPLDYISVKEQFFGLEITSKQPFYLPYLDSTHLLYCGATRSAKGVALSHRVVEAIRQNKGVIILDPKKDDFLAQVVLEELKRQNRTQDLIIASWPNNFIYSGFNKDDSSIEFANKLIVALDLAPSGDPKSDYYRRNERTLLKKIIEIFFDSKVLLNREFEYNYKSLINFIKYLYSELVSKQAYESEISKSKPNMNLIESFSKRYFEPELFQKLDLQYEEISTLKGLYQTIIELCDANIYSKINLDDALYNGKVIYIQADQLDVSSLKMLKVLQVDIIQKAKKKTANCIVIADEVSFYATKTLSDSLSVIAGFGVQYILALQDLAQLNDPVIKNPILSNCSTKLFYKSSDIETLEYIQKISGLELVTQVTKRGNETSMRQLQEELLNITRLRALKRDRVAVIIAESLNTPVITQTWHIEVRCKFDWEPYQRFHHKIEITSLKKVHKVSTNDDIVETFSEIDKKELQL